MRRTLAIFGMFLFVGPAAAQAASGTIDKIKETGTIAIGFQEVSVPFSYLDGNNQPVGYAIDICRKVVDGLEESLGIENIKVNFVPVTAANRTPLLLNGTIDVHCASASNTEDRQKQVAFTNTHFLTANKFVARTADNLTKIDDLAGKAVASVAGSVNIAQLNAVNNERSLGIRILSAKDQSEGFRLLTTGRASAYVGDDVLVATEIARTDNPAEYAFGEEALSDPAPYGIIIRREDPAFKEIVDRLTAELYASPEIEKIYTKWFQSPIPPNGINLNYPIPPALANAFKHPSSSWNPADYVPTE